MSSSFGSCERRSMEESIRVRFEIGRSPSCPASPLARLFLRGMLVIFDIMGRYVVNVFVCDSIAALQQFNNDDHFSRLAE